MLQACDLLEAWDRAGSPASTTSRAVELLAAVRPETAPRTWSIGRRDRALLELHRRWFGARLLAVARCRGCGEPIELDFTVDDLGTHLSDREEGSIELEGHRVVFRRLTSDDVELALQAPTHAEGVRRLVERAIVSITGDSVLSDAGVAALGAAIAELDPDSDLSLDVACPECSVAFQIPFDIAAYVWAELDRWALGLLEEIHLLASAYGWTEPQILALSPNRRRAYLERVTR